MKRIIASLLALITIIGSIGIIAIVPVSAASTIEHIDIDTDLDDASKIAKYFQNTYYYTDEQKLATMTLMKEENGYEIWVQKTSGEVAIRDAKTGECLFTNPIDVASTSFTNVTNGTISNANKNKLLSQIILTYDANGKPQDPMYSFVEAAQRNQITVKNIKGGIRVEYMMGEDNVTRLVPRLMTKARYDQWIASAVALYEDNFRDYFYAKKLLISGGYYELKDPNDPDLTADELNDMYALYPITKTGVAVVAITSGLTSAQLATVETYVKKYCPNYTFEEMLYDHDETGYVGSDDAQPLFRMALEYSIQADGSLEVRLPANSIRYDESAYTLKDIQILPYFGVGANDATGYLFFPDGSGTLYRYEDLLGVNYKKTAKLYGEDYAYHTLYTTIEDSFAHSESVRYPVYGSVTNINKTEVETIVVEEPTDENPDGVTETITHTTKKDTGYVAIITEGDSLTTLNIENSNQHPYATVYPSFTPHPSDTYAMNDSVSVGDNTTWTVTAKSKFTGSYRIRYYMLQDKDICASEGKTKYYDTSYVGMAYAYRDYLYSTNQLSKLTSGDVSDTTPLLIESFGSIETIERVLSFPVTVDTPLTTFDDIKSMYDELASGDFPITNVNFRLTGFANGGMKSTIPYKLNWVDACGGADGFKDLLEYAKEKGFGVYPEFDFAYSSYTELFDGFSIKTHAVRTIDNRYIRKQVYSAGLQSYSMGTMVAISASVYNYFFEKFSSNYNKYNPIGISVSTLGTDLSSDFDEDESYNREETKVFTMDMLRSLKDAYGTVVVDGGNAYAYKYSDIIVNVSTDSSKYIVASEAVPFLGIVLHGSVVCTGEPINMEGDVYYAILKAIENGYYLNFTLSYRNTQYMKEDAELSKYYSVKFEYWKDDVVKFYNMLNDATKDLQTSFIIDHEFLEASRVANPDEVIADAAELQNAINERIEYLRVQAIKAEKAKRLENGTEKGLPIEVDVPTTLEPSQYTDAINAILNNQANRYKVQSGTVIRVEYEGDVNFILNYNTYDVTLEYNGEVITVPALGFLRIN